MDTVPHRLRAALFLFLTSLGCSDSSGPTGTASDRIIFTGRGPTAGIPAIQALFSVPLEGGPAVQLTPDSMFSGMWVRQEVSPWVSPDGQRIAVQVEDWSSGQWQLTLFTVDTSGALLSVASLPRVECCGTVALSPDGSRVAWFAGGYLYIAAPDSTAVQATYFDSTVTFTDLEWSRDGGSVAYVAIPRNQDGQVWTVRLADDFRRQLTHSSGYKASPAWSRDGRWLALAWAEGYGSEQEIHRVRTDGGGTEQVVVGGAGVSARLPSWGPGDSLLALALSRGAPSNGASDGVTVIRPDGSRAGTLATGYIQVSPAWGN
jgi:Tol biopolymer transport system component